MTKIKGLDRLNRKLKRLPQATKDQISEAIAQSAREIVDMAVNLVPVDSGDLAGSIGWTWGKAPKGAMTLGVVKSSGSELVATVYAGDSEAFYARWVEFGTQKMTAQPFFYPSYRALRKRSKSRIKRAVTKAAKKVAAGG